MELTNPLLNPVYGDKLFCMAMLLVPRSNLRRSINHALRTLRALGKEQTAAEIDLYTRTTQMKKLVKARKSPLARVEKETRTRKCRFGKPQEGSRFSFFQHYCFIFHFIVCVPHYTPCTSRTCGLGARVKNAFFSHELYTAGTFVCALLSSDSSGSELVQPSLQRSIFKPDEEAVFVILCARATALTQSRAPIDHLSYEL